MDAKTLEALKASIAKWERNAVAATAKDYLTGTTDCALCELFYSYTGDCTGCPVREKTGHKHCRETPYDKASDFAQNWFQFGNGFRPSAIRWAKKEVAFLKSLLPTEEPSP